MFKEFGWLEGNGQSIVQGSKNQKIIHSGIPSQNFPFIAIRFKRTYDGLCSLLSHRRSKNILYNFSKEQKFIMGRMHIKTTCHVSNFALNCMGRFQK